MNTDKVRLQKERVQYIKYIKELNAGELQGIKLSNSRQNLK